MRRLFRKKERRWPYLNSPRVRSDPRTCWGRALLETGIVFLVIMDVIAIIPALSSNRNPNWGLYGLGKVGPLNLCPCTVWPEPPSLVRV